MSQSSYHFDGEQRFIIEQYNDQTPFASFLPGIAGTRGRPAWVFYVNRGQAIASFGVRNKDGAFLEFFPADKAYQLTASRGFRTFVKIDDGKQIIEYEPFQRCAGNDVKQRLLISAHEVGIEECHPRLGLSFRTDTFTLPQAPVAGLLRRVEIHNASDKTLRLDIVDGLPQVLPYAMNQWIVKFMSCTSEAFMRVENLQHDMPFYRLKVWPTDTPQVEPVIAGHFFAGFLNGKCTRAIVDAETVFGLAGDFVHPERFFSTAALDLSQQITANQNPAAMQTMAIELAPGASQVFYGVYAHAPSPEVMTRYLSVSDLSDFFERQRDINRCLIDDIRQRAFTLTASPLFDAHVQQCYLDNGLRGGFPQTVLGGAHLYLFGRKHGDLERDYNDFLLQDTPYSEGNGDFRDVLQNRRMDLLFDPSLDDKNIRYFFNLIQPDGYNPCSLRNSRFIVDEPLALVHYFSDYPALQALLAGEFKYAELWQILHDETNDREFVIGEILAHGREIEDAEFDRGYWSDHWTYLLDLLLGYQAIFPDRLHDLFNRDDYSFFDTAHFVQPRVKKYHMTADGLRQYGAVSFNSDKQALIDSRSRRRHQVRALHGRGDIVHTTLLGKILTLVINKLATLDPAGMGIEMEADRPGWCDALNGLPGILGSAVNETLELKRLVDFTRDILRDIAAPCPIPIELAEFLLALSTLLQCPGLTALDFWRDAGTLKEHYRQRIGMGFEGTQSALSLEQIRVFLDAASQRLQTGIDNACTSDGIVTYFSYDAEEYRELADGHVEVVRFRQTALPLFLEGFVHAMRIAEPPRVRELYAAATRSKLYDCKLGMYRLNEPLGDDALALGRIGVFNDGWLENGSIFLHMHYKFVLEMVRGGLLDEFYADRDKLLVAFRNPDEYKRNPIENSSFLVSSGFSVDTRQHGRGCVARLSGSTVELLQLWSYLFLGDRPFVFESGQLCFRPEPKLAGSLFSTQKQEVSLLGQQHTIAADSACCLLFSTTLLVYVNPARRDTFGSTAVKPCRFQLHAPDGHMHSVEGPSLPANLASALRQGAFQRIDILLG